MYCIHIYIHTYIYIYIQGQETFLAPSADKQTRSYDTECSNPHSSLSTLRPKGLSRSMMKW